MNKKSQVALLMVCLGSNLGGQVSWSVALRRCLVRHGAQGDT